MTNTSLNFRFKARIAATLMALFASAGAAATTFSTWYVPGGYGSSFDYGDITFGSTLMTPPPWACGVRFENASTLRWRDQHANTISAEDLYKDLHVWLPLPGCPYPNNIVVEYKDGSKTFAPPSGTHRLDVATNYGRRWINEDGTWTACNCAPVGSLAIKVYDWIGVTESITGLKTAIGESSLQVKLLMVDAFSALDELRDKVDVATASRTSLGSREDAVSSTERHVHRALEGAEQMLTQCREDLESRAQAERAYRSCDIALSHARDAKELWRQITDDTK